MSMLRAGPALGGGGSAYEFAQPPSAVPLKRAPYRDAGSATKCVLQSEGRGAALCRGDGRGAWGGGVSDARGARAESGWAAARSSRSPPIRARGRAARPPSSRKEL